MSTNRTTHVAQGLRRKAAALHRRADQALSERRVWDAGKHRQRARTLEARADAMDAQPCTGPELAGGFADDDLPTGHYTAQPRGWA